MSIDGDYFTYKNYIWTLINNYIIIDVKNMG